MKITKMTLKKYRNYDNLEISFNDNLNIIIGDNAQGKTNLFMFLVLLDHFYLVMTEILLNLKIRLL